MVPGLHTLFNGPLYLHNPAHSRQSWCRGCVCHPRTPDNHFLKLFYLISYAALFSSSMFFWLKQAILSLTHEHKARPRCTFPTVCLSDLSNESADMPAKQSRTSSVSRFGRILWVDFEGEGGDDPHHTSRKRIMIQKVCEYIKIMSADCLFFHENLKFISSNDSIITSFQK